MGIYNCICTIDNLPYLFYYTAYIINMFVMQTILLSFLNSVDMSGSENVYGYICYRPLNISYQTLNVGLWSKIGGFCNFHAKLILYS